MGTAVNQRRANPGLQRLYPAAKRGLGNPAQQGRYPKIAFGVEGEEILEPIDFHIALLPLIAKHHQNRVALSPTPLNTTFLKKSSKLEHIDPQFATKRQRIFFWHRDPGFRLQLILARIHASTVA